MTPSEKIAWLISGDLTIAVKANDSDKNIFCSPVLQLIHHVYSTYPQDAHRILRARILTTESESMALRRIVRVAAKRIAFVAEPSRSVADAAIEAPIRQLEANPIMSSLDLQLFSDDLSKILLVKSLAENVPTEANRYSSNRKIAAALFRSDGKCFAASTNTNQTNRLKHAEWNLLLHATEKLGGKIPSDWTIATSLSPCSMCGEIITKCCIDGSEQKVIYLDEDVGTLGKNLSLSQMRKIDLTM